MGRNSLGWIVLAVPALTACATVSKPTMEIDTRVLASTPVKLDHPGKLVVREPVFRGEVLSAKLGVERLCYDAIRRDVQHQRVERRETSNLAYDFVIGGLLTTGGGVTLGIAPRLPEESDEELKKKGSKLTTRTWGYLAGSAALAGGLGWMIHGIAKAAAGRDRKVDAPWVQPTFERRSEDQVCGLDPPPRGELRLAYGHTTTAQVPVVQPDFSVDLEALREKLCSGEKHLGTALTIEFVPEGGMDPVAVATRDMDDCIRAEVATRHLARAAAGPSESTPLKEIQALSETLNRAQGLASGMTDGNPERALLLKRIADSAARVGAVAGTRLDGQLAAFKTVCKTGDRESIGRGAAEILLLGSLVPERKRQSWEAAWTGFIANATKTRPDALPDALEGLGRLLKIDSGTAQCLEDADNCPAGLDRADVVAVFKPLFARLEKDLDVALGRLAQSRKTVERNPTERTVQALVDSSHGAEKALSRCLPRGWNEAIERKCASAGPAIADASRAVLAAQPRLEKLRIEQTANAWRRFFSRCRQVSSALVEMRQLGSCDADCRKVKAQVEAEYRSLGAFKVPEGPLDRETWEMLRVECAEAGCPRCP